MSGDSPSTDQRSEQAEPCIFDHTTKKRTIGEYGKH